MTDKPTTPTQVSLNERILEILKENTSIECGDDYKFEITNIDEAANAIERLILCEKIDLLNWLLEWGNANPEYYAKDKITELTNTLNKLP